MCEDPESAGWYETFVTLADVAPEVLMRRIALLNSGRICGSVLNSLSVMLNNSEGKIRKAAIQALYILGPRAAPATAAIVAAMKDRELSVSVMACGLLTEIQWPPLSAMPHLEAAAKDSNKSVREAAAELLNRVCELCSSSLYRDFAHASPSSQQVMIASLSSDKVDIQPDDSALDRAVVVSQLGRSGGPPEQIIPLLISALADTEAIVRNVAIRALNEIDGLSEDVIAALVVALEDSDVNVRSGAAVLLRKFGPAAVSAVMALTRMLRETDQLIPELAGRTLAQIGAGAIPALISLLGDSSLQVQEQAAEALSIIGSQSVPAIVAAMQHPVGNIASAAAKLLARLAPETVSSMCQPREVSGLERMGDKAIKLIGPLEVFYRIGAICNKKNTNSFALIKISRALPKLLVTEVSESPASIRRHMAAVSLFFRRYYEEYEHLKIPPDDDGDTSPDSGKFIARTNGGREQVICQLGWRAWHETKKFLVPKYIPIDDDYLDKMQFDSQSPRALLIITALY